MVLTTCDKCLKRFRKSKEKESLCAKCAVDNLPEVEDVAKMEAEFNGFAEQIYGKKDREAMPLVFNVDNVFNHRSRLSALRELNEKEKTNKSTKERQKSSREVNRLAEESNAIHDRIKTMKDNLMSVLMLASTIKQPEYSNKEQQQQQRVSDDRVGVAVSVPVAATRVARIPEVPELILEKKKETFITPPKKEPLVVVEQPMKNPEPEDELMPLIRSNSVRNRILELQKANREVIRVPEESNNRHHSPIIGGGVKHDGSGDNMVSVMITCTMQPVPVANARGGGGGGGDHLMDIVDKKETPNMEEADQPSEPEDDELMPLKRSNSVRNRIQAFEALSRRASTGTWDRGASPRRKLNF